MGGGSHVKIPTEFNLPGVFPVETTTAVQRILKDQTGSSSTECYHRVFIMQAYTTRCLVITTIGGIRPVAPDGTTPTLIPGQPQPQPLSFLYVPRRVVTTHAMHLHGDPCTNRKGRKKISPPTKASVHLIDRVIDTGPSWKQPS